MSEEEIRYLEQLMSTPYLVEGAFSELPINSSVSISITDKEVRCVQTPMAMAALTVMVPMCCEVSNMLSVVAENVKKPGLEYLFGALNGAFLNMDEEFIVSILFLK